MRKCPCCGYTENPLWQQSRFVANYMFMRKEDFKNEYPKLWIKVSLYKPVQEGDFVYLLTTRSIYVKRLEIVNGSACSNYEANTTRTGGIQNINRWVKKQNSIRSKKQLKLFSSSALNHTHATDNPKA